MPRSGGNGVAIGLLDVQNYLVDRHKHVYYSYYYYRVLCHTLTLFLPLEIILQVLPAHNERGCPDSSTTGICLTNIRADRCECVSRPWRGRSESKLANKRDFYHLYHQYISHWRGYVKTHAAHVNTSHTPYEGTLPQPNLAKRAYYHHHNLIDIFK